MSYVVSIVREAPIDESELEDIASRDRGFELDRADDTIILRWIDPESDMRESFVLIDGSLDITTPSDAALIVAQALAAHLGAKVIGEEGEDLTDADVSGNVTTSSGCGPMTGTFAIIGLFLILYWLFAS